MFFHHDLKGFDAPEKTLCLTYDDGPGEQTLELARYLHDAQIVAAFFMVGQHIELFPDAPRKVAELGHDIGNHTYCHAGLVDWVEAERDIVGQIAKTDALLSPSIAKPRKLLRPPYGSWRRKRDDSAEEEPVSRVAGILNRAAFAGSYIGPIHWDISAADYDFWRRGDSALACSAAYLTEIERAGRGIVLMHDSSEEAGTRARNRTYDVTRLLIPELLSRGYRFVGIYEMPQIACAMGV